MKRPRWLLLRLLLGLPCLMPLMAAWCAPIPGTCRPELDEAACLARCDDHVEPLRQSISPPSPTTGRCERVEGRIGCVCFGTDDERPDVDDDTTFDRSRDHFLTDASCEIRGRPGHCLVPPSSFPGCQLDSEAGDRVCELVCADVDEALARDAAGYQVDIVDAEALCNDRCFCDTRFNLPGDRAREVCVMDTDLPPEDVCP